MYYKYPRTPHLPWSEGATNDDKVLKNTHHFEGKEIVATLKMDGENTTMYPNHIHARSIDSGRHPARFWVKALHSKICFDIPPDHRICGENLFAKHTIFYDNLPSYFMVHSIWFSNRLNVNQCCSWEGIEHLCKLLGLYTVPVIYTGIWNKQTQHNIERLFNKFYTKHEGYVVRLAEPFAYDDFATSVAKWVRKDHVQTDDHWMYSKIIRNKLGTD